MSCQEGSKESLLPVVQELERARDFFSAKFFDNKLNDIVITIQTKGRKQALGWFRAERWKNDKAAPIHEVNISAEHLRQDPTETLIHELVHAYNHVLKVKDCSGNQYHNKHFKEQAERVGLIVTHDVKYGYGHTSLGVELKKVIDLEFKLQDSVFNIFRREQTKKKKQETKMKKWVCGCGVIVRCAVELAARCEECQELFVKDDS